MGKLTVFNHVSLDGYFTDAKGDMSWAYEGVDEEFSAFTSENARSGGGGIMLFGKVTYDLMAAYWPTPAAEKAMPDVARKMNSSPKVVFSRSMDRAVWSNTKFVKGDVASEVWKMKNESDMIIFGSGTIVSPLAEAGLIDEYDFIVNPVILGKGRTLFEGMSKKLKLKLTKSRVFKNGKAHLCYEPAV